MTTQLASDVTDEEWELIAPLLAPAKLARPRKYAARLMFSAVLYIARTGCSWRQLPPHYPPWPAVYWSLKRWAETGLLMLMNQALVPLTRKKGGSVNASALSSWTRARPSLPVAVSK